MWATRTALLCGLLTVSASASAVSKAELEARIQQLIVKREKVESLIEKVDGTIMVIEAFAPDPDRSPLPGIDEALLKQLEGAKTDRHELVTTRDELEVELSRLRDVAT